MEPDWWRCPIHNILIRTNEICQPCKENKPPGNLRPERIEDSTGNALQIEFLALYPKREVNRLLVEKP